MLANCCGLSSASSRSRFSRRCEQQRLGEGNFCWTLKNFSRLSDTDDRVYSPPFTYGGISFMLLLFPRGNQQQNYASLYLSIADKTKLPPVWCKQVLRSM